MLKSTAVGPHMRLSFVTLFAGMLLVACVSIQPNDVQVDSTPAKYSDAIARLQPLGLVQGTLRETASIPSGDPASGLEHAIAYAQRTGSYALLIWHDGALRLERYFSGYDSSLRPESASMHKTVLGLAVIAAISDGHIKSVDEFAATYLPEWQNDNRQRITIRNLLTMTSGLKPLSTDGGANSASRRFFTDGRAARSTILKMEAAHQPGTRFHYANTDSQLLGLLLERAVGQPYESYLSTRLWQEIGAGDAYVWYNEASGFARTYTALLARARDWLRVGLLLKDHGEFDGNQVLPREMMQSMASASVRNPRYGWQVWRGTEASGERFYNEERTGLAVAQSEQYILSDLIFLDGFGGQRVYISRKHDLVIVRLGDVRMDWDDAVLPNRVAESLVGQDEGH